MNLETEKPKLQEREPLTLYLYENAHGSAYMLFGGEVMVGGCKFDSVDDLVEDVRLHLDRHPPDCFKNEVPSLLSAIKGLKPLQDQEYFSLMQKIGVPEAAYQLNTYDS